VDQFSSLQIYVKMTKTLALDVNSTDTVDQIKSKIGSIEGIDKSQQALFFAGNHLENDNRIADYDITTNSCVDLYVTDGMQISVSIPSVGKTIKLNVTNSQSVADVKAVIEQKGGVPLGEQILMCAGRQLEDHQMLSQCGLSNGQALHVLVCPTGNLRVLVDIGGRKTINLDVKCWYTVADVKLLIETLEGSPACTQVLSTEIGGDTIVLKDTDTHHSQHVKNNDILTLHMDRTVQFFVRTLEGKTLTMMQNLSDTTKDIMKKIEERLPIKPGIYRLCYRGHAMSLEDPLLKYKVESDTTIHICLIGEVKGKQKG
jgi:ubiquitin C